MFAPSIALAWGDFAILKELYKLAREGSFPLGEFQMPSLDDAIFKLSAARIFAMQGLCTCTLLCSQIRGQIVIPWPETAGPWVGEVPCRIKPLEETMAILLGIDLNKLSPEGIQESISSGESPKPDRLLATLAQGLYVWLAQAGSNASEAEVPNVPGFDLGLDQK